MAKDTAQTADAPPSFQDRAENALLSGLINACRALPYATRVPTFAKINRHLIAPLAGYGKRAEANLAEVWPDRPQAQRRAIAAQSLENAGRVLIENYSHPAFFNRAKNFEPQGAGLRTLEAAKSEGRPVILATGHFGNYEAPRAALVARGYDIGGLYRPAANPLVNAHYRKTMEAMGPPVFPQGRPGLKGLMRHLSKGGMAVLLTDVHDYRADLMDFLGTPARTATSAAELALRYKADLIPFYGTRINGGLDYAVDLEDPIPHSDPITMTKALTRSLEARILADPGQWFWIHRRWKR